MSKLRVIVEQRKNSPAMYANEVNASNFKEIALVLRDLKNLSLPIEKAIKEFNLEKSDWDAALGL